MKAAILWLVTFIGTTFIVRPAAHADQEVAITPDIVYGHKDGLAMTMDVFRPKDKEALNGVGIMFMVSGGWFSPWIPPEKFQDIAKPMVDKGFTVFAVRHGSSPRYKIPEIVADVRRCVRYVRHHAQELGVDPDRLGVCGFSAGGHLSLMLGTTADEGDPQAEDTVLRASDRVAAVVAYFPPTDIRAFVDEKSPYYKNYPALQFEPEKAGDYSPLLHVTPDDAPTLLVHGDKDELVPLDHSQNILDALKEKQVPAELLVIQGAAHGFQGEDGKRATDSLVGWFEKQLLKK